MRRSNAAWLFGGLGLALIALIVGWCASRDDKPKPAPPPATLPATEPSDRDVEASGLAHVGKVQVTGGKIDNAQVVAARLEPRFRRCYSRGLVANPKLAGSLLLTVTVNGRGGVERVEGDADALRPIVGCVHAAVQAAAFAAPEGGSSEVSIPVTFTNQQAR